MTAAARDWAAKIAARLGALRLPMSSERAMQDAIWAACAADCRREHRLSAADRIDFFLPVSAGPEIGVGIEVKLKGSKRALVDQLVRYAAHDAIGALVLVSSIVVALPTEISGAAA